MMRSALLLVVVTACGKSAAVPEVTPIAACPDGAVMVGAAPPEGLRQRCQKSDTERHGASREWYQDRRERSYSEWWDGEKHGRFTLWFKNGKLRSQGAHRFGVPAGEWTYFNEAGTPQQTKKFPVEPPAADWLALAVAGHPPAKEPRPAEPTGGRTLGSSPDPADPQDPSAGW